MEYDPSHSQRLLHAHQEWHCLSSWNPPGTLLCPGSPQVSVCVCVCARMCARLLFWPHVNSLQSTELRGDRSGDGTRTHSCLWRPGLVSTFNSTELINTPTDQHTPACIHILYMITRCAFKKYTYLYSLIRQGIRQRWEPSAMVAKFLCGSI